jgi:acetate kinase
MKVLVLNGGSTSVKAAVFDGASEPLRFSVSSPDGARALDEIGGRVDWASLEAVGHRVVHGGERHLAPCRVSRELLADLRELAPFDPTHLPRELDLIEQVGRRRPDLPQVVCFDTAFHATLPAVARLLPLPRRLYQLGVRRYGFHGLSYQWIIEELERRFGAAAARGRLVIAHLGGGASLVAVREGRSLDTTMGFSPTAGIPMATRSGDVDPGVIAFLARREGMTAEQFATMASEQSGLLGVSGTSGDLRALTARAATDPHAAEAIALFCYEVKKRIGAFAAVLGGIDRLVFTGGIGEHAAHVRAAVCQGLEFLGLALDPARNAAHQATVSSEGAAVAVHVLPTDEERVVLAGVLSVLSAVERKT